MFCPCYLTTTSQEMTIHATRHANIGNVKWCIISTYGIWNGNGYNTEVSSFFSTINRNEIDTSLIVGYHKDKKESIISELLDINSKYIHSVMSENHHAKYIVFSDGTAFIGSANMTNSSYPDICAVIRLLPDMLTEFKKYHDKLYNKYRGQNG